MKFKVELKVFRMVVVEADDELQAELEAVRKLKVKPSMVSDMKVSDNDDPSQTTGWETADQEWLARA